MTTKDYCFDIITSDKVVDRDIIVNHLYSLFKNQKRFGDIAFKIDEKFPIDFGVSDLWKNHKQVCLDSKTRSKQLKNRIKRILRECTEEDLKVSDTIQLKKPSDIKVCDLDRFKNGKGEQRWKMLEHNGPYFRQLDPSVKIDRLHADLIYDGKRYPLNNKESLVASFFAKRIITEENSKKKYIENKQFISNFFTDFKKYLSPEHLKLFRDFKKLDFHLLVDEIKEIKMQKEEEKKRLRAEREAEKEREKELSKKNKSKKEESYIILTINQLKEVEEKRKERLLKLEKKLNYSFAFVDNMKKNIRNSGVELPGLYVGAGDNMANKGKIKGEYFPEDITINCSKGKDPLPPKGHKWGKIVHDNTANWTAQYRDKTTGKLKYILLAETGDLLKFEKARKLNKHIEEVDQRIESLLHSKNKKEAQIGCALYLIKEYGIRVGNECDEEEKCDKSEKVVGATTLMVQNVECKEEKDDSDEEVVEDFVEKYYIELSFKGKDSVSYNNTLKVSKRVFELIKKFVKGKHNDEKVFDLITSNDVNSYLKSIDKDFSAKVFRTRLASSIMYDGLKELDYDDDVDDQQKIKDFLKVNLKVAIKLNHKKGVTDAVKESLRKEKEKLKELKEKIKSEEDEKKKTKMKKEFLEKRDKFETKDSLKEVALNTSLKNYIDPRIVKAWAEYVNLGGCKDIEENEEGNEENEENEEENENDKDEIKHCVNKIYANTEMLHFRWAIENDVFDEDWDYNETELDCIVGEELDPEINKDKKDNKDKKEISIFIQKLKKIDESSEQFTKCVVKIAKKYNVSEKEVLKQYKKIKK